MYADPTLMDLAAAYAKRRNGRKTKHAVACDRPGAKAKMGLLDRLGAAASALAGPGKDPTTQEYKTSVAEAKKAAIDEVKNYAFMVKQNEQKLAALDAYVKSTSKAIATLNSAPEILRLTDGLRQAVKARSVLLQTLKMPFGRKKRFDANAKEQEFRTLTNTINSIALEADDEIDELEGMLHEGFKQLEGRKDASAKQLAGDGKKLMSLLDKSRVDTAEGSDWYDDPTTANINKMKRQLQMTIKDAEKVRQMRQSVMAWLKQVRDSAGMAERTVRGRAEKILNDAYNSYQFLDKLLSDWERAGKGSPKSRTKPVLELRRKIDALGARSDAAREQLDKLNGQFDQARGEQSIVKIGEAAKIVLNTLSTIRKEALAVTSELKRDLEAKDALPEAKYREDPTGRHSRPGKKAKSTHAALPPQTLEAERKPGGGSHSEAVSRKIATLINEGKPQDQAVAIALDLKRRGEL